MLIGYNTIPYYELKSQQRWIDADNRDVVIIFDTNQIPAFVLVSDTSASSATVQIFDAQTDLAVGSSQAVTVADLTGAKSLKFLGTLLTSQSCGYYYSKIVAGGDTYYSEVFGWEDDASDLLKISAVSSNLTIAGEYELDLSSVTFECYVNAEKAISEPEIEEESEEKPFGNLPVFNTMSTNNSFEITGTRAIYIFLTGLRILKTNGTVIFTYDGITMDAYDITTESKDDISFSEIVVVGLSFREENYISSRNDI